MLDPVCQVVTGGSGAIGSAVSDSILGGLGSAFVSAADQVSATALGVLDASTSVDLTAAWFTRNVSVLAAITLPAVVGLFTLQVLTAVLRREPGGLGRAVIGGLLVATFATLFFVPVVYTYLRNKQPVDLDRQIEDEQHELETQEHPI